MELVEGGIGGGTFGGVFGFQSSGEATAAVFAGAAAFAGLRAAFWCCLRNESVGRSHLALGVRQD